MAESTNRAPNSRGRRERIRSLLRHKGSIHGTDCGLKPNYRGSAQLIGMSFIDLDWRALVLYGVDSLDKAKNGRSQCRDRDDILIRCAELPFLTIDPTGERRDLFLDKLRELRCVVSRVHADGDASGHMATDPVAISEDLLCNADWNTVFDHNFNLLLIEKTWPEIVGKVSRSSLRTTIDWHKFDFVRDQYPSDTGVQVRFHSQRLLAIKDDLRCEPLPIIDRFYDVLRVRLHILFLTLHLSM